MFGDLGHGFLLLLVALFLIKMENSWLKKLPTDLLEIPFGGRYVILLMSMFAMYCGALYNEFFSQPINFGSAWQIDYGWYTNATGTYSWPNNTFSTERDPAKRWSYAFGVDPVWKGATDELLFYNSVKMKMAVIVGVTQMSIGLFLKFLNGINFRQPLDIFFEMIPQLVFLWSIFGYLCVMIVYKWNQDYYYQDAVIYNMTHFLNNGTFNGVQNTCDHMGTSDAPLLLNELIFMFLPRPAGGCPLYPGQQTVQLILKILAGVSIPVMMFAKPIFLCMKHRKRSGEYQSVAVVNSTDSESDENGHAQVKAAGGHDAHGHGEFEFSDAMIHQALETVEFVLGSVSHTASYLRLWALSLAHSELATVFWDKTFFQTFSLGAVSLQSAILTGLLSFAGVSAWIAATLGIILFMETLSAFLHALRLHWVEFQSKFYKGDGHLFLPFSYERILAGETEE